MSPDDYQQAWQAHSSQTRVTIDADVLLKEVQRNQNEFKAQISLGNVAFLGILVMLIPVWIFMGVTISPPWTWYLMVPAFIWIIGFVLVGRSRQKPAPNEPGEPLLNCAKESLSLVDHQIWSARKIVWWYLLPMGIPLLTFLLHVSVLKARSLKDALTDVNAVVLVFFLAIACLIYYLSQFSIRKQYEPRRQELLRLITSLGDESAGEVRGEYPILTRTAQVHFSTRRLIVAGVFFVAILVVGVPGILFGAQFIDSVFNREYPKLSPFTAVRWQNDTPEVQIEGEWFTLVSLDGLAAEDIVTYCKREYADKWQTRFGEDLVEVLEGMGHHPEDTVNLVALPIGSTTPRTFDNIRMTYDNRRAIRDARLSISDNGPKVPLTELVPTLRSEKELVGLAAMVMTDGKIVESAVDGERKSGSGVRLAIGDRWHLGSITKSITATMIARLVESGQMHWTDTVGTYFPDAPIHADWKQVTIRQLLTHTSGAPPNFPQGVALNKPALGSESTHARREAVLDLMTKKPIDPPGTKNVYSNVGFTIAGAMAEQATGVSWDHLVQREVFEPLALTSAGFGPPKSVKKRLEQPQGHTTAFGWKTAAGEDADNTFIIGPAGIVHMSLEDLCTYATEHLRGERGEGKLLSAESYKFLHKPELDDYACGWVKNDPGSRIPHTLFWHNGSNTMWYALVVFIPDTNTVIAVTSNDGDIKNAESAAWDIVNASAK